MNRPEPNDPFPDIILYGPEIEIEEPTIGEVKTAIKTLRNNKSPGKDNIPSEIWKLGGEVLENRLYKLIGMIWREEKTPDDWEEGILVPLHKKGDRLTCKNYRGISLWSTAYKIFTIILYNRISVYSETIVGEYQAGFRKNRSTTDQLFTIRQINEKYWEFNKYALHLFIDYKQAYDSIHRPSMWNILKEMGIPSKLIRLTKTCYTNTKCSVRYGGKTTSSFTIRNGLKQGCILSPMLFNIVMEKVARTVTERQLGAQFRDLSINCLAYADDVDVITEDIEDTENIITEFKEKAEKVGLTINEEKTKLMEMTRNPQLQVQNHINISNMNIEVVDKFKYLGMMITTDGNMKEEIDARIGAASRCYFSLLDLFKKRSISEKTKLRVYNTIIRPILLYGCETWALTKVLEKRLEVFENKILRKITGPIFDQETLEWRIRHNWEIRDRTQQPHISQVVKSRRIQLAGHIARMEDTRLPKQMLTAEVIGRRPLGRPRKDWHRCLREDLNSEGIEMNTWMDLAQDRGGWKRLARAVKGQRVAQRPVE